MINLLEEKKWENYRLSFFDNLNLYLAEKKQDYSKEYEESDREIGLVNSNGQWIYKCAENESLLLKHHWYCSKLEESLNKSLNFWTTYKNIGDVNKPIDKISIFKYENGHVIELLPNLNVHKSIVISQNKIVIGILQNLENINETQKINIKIFNTKTNDLVDVIETTNYEDESFNFQLQDHIVYGDQYLFSVKIDELSKWENVQFYLFDNNGKKLLDYKITHGDSGKLTWFEPTKTGFGITYKLLPNKLKIDYNETINKTIKTSECLIDLNGKHYGEFLSIHGANPYIGTKSYTKYPKFIDKKILCSTLPDKDNISYLVFFDKQGNRTDTPYQCPWVDTTFFKQCAFISDKKYFGKKCLVIVDKDNMVQLIDFDGNLIKNVIPASYESVGFFGNYMKYFIDQVI